MSSAGLAMESAHLTAKKRLGVLRAVLGFTVKELTAAKVNSPAGAVPVISSNYDVVRKCIGDKHTYPRFHRRYQEQVLMWLRDRYGLILESTIFTKECKSVADFERIIRGDGKIVGKMRTGSPFGDAALDEMAVVIKAAENLSEMDTPYVSGGDLEPFGLVVSSRLADLIVRSGKVPPPSMIGRLAAVVPLCGGCGKGADAFVAHKASLRSIWSRRQDLIATCADDEQVVGLAAVGARLSQATRLDANAPAARLLALETMGILGLVPPSPEKTKVVTRLQDALREDEPCSLEANIALGVIERQFGQASREYVGELKCRACRAVGCASRGAEAAIEAARNAVTVAKRGNARDASGLDQDWTDLDFLELLNLERNLLVEPRKTQERIRRNYGVERLGDLLRRTKAPIRKARVAVSILRVSSRSKDRLRREALSLLDQRPHVKALCILDVEALRAELMLPA